MPPILWQDDRPASHGLGEIRWTMPTRLACASSVADAACFSYTETRTHISFSSLQAYYILAATRSD